jgi:cytochrome c biogenesis protein CcmG/thiol:disulfide interchange protein DsbE
VVLVNFWASWCYPACWNEAPRLQAAWERYREKGLVMVGIVYQDREPNAREFIRKHGKTYPNGVDPKSRIAIDYGVYGVPETFFIDREGRIAHKHVGEIPVETLTREIERLL